MLDKTMAVARWDCDVEVDDYEQFDDGNYVLFTDYARDINNLKHDIFVLSDSLDYREGLMQSLRDSVDEYRTEAAKLDSANDALLLQLDNLRAEVEGLTRDAERYRMLRAHADHTDEYQIGPGGTMLVGYAEDEDIFNGEQLDMACDAAMEKGNV